MENKEHAMEEQPDGTIIPVETTGNKSASVLGSAASFITPDWVVITEDPDTEAEFYTDETCARKRLEQLSMGYTVHLYQKIESR